jgi:hypothetical protein
VLVNELQLNDHGGAPFWQCGSQCDPVVTATASDGNRADAGRILICFGFRAEAFALVIELLTSLFCELFLFFAAKFVPALGELFGAGVDASGEGG